MGTPTALDYFIIIFFFLIPLLIIIWDSKKYEKYAQDFFSSAKTSCCWLLGLSMFTADFSSDTSRFIPNVLRLNGVSVNWVRWTMVFKLLLAGFLNIKRLHRFVVNAD
ncbi:hypothetical protein [uncultured Polaribacter sp.]|uniref:hypothetical protein n=1 Tax=uncultured Polaribacter sp. TaxID=174711 RepID=UPI0032B187C5